MKTEDEFRAAAVTAAMARGLSRDAAIAVVERWGARDVLTLASNTLPRPNGTPPARRAW